MRTNSTRTAVGNAIVEYYAGIQDAVDLLGPRSGRGDGLEPGFDLPQLEPDVVDFYSVSGLSVADLGSYRGRRLRLLNLMHNPRTRTTKTLASLVIVARAVGHIRVTNERVMILTPSSANKGTALRDAVLRAHERSLVPADQLQISIVVPRGSLSKLWRSPLTEDPGLRARNPVFTYEGGEPEDVKAISRDFASRWGPEIKSRWGVNLWYTLDLNNYRVADSVRAYFEAEALPPDPGRVRVHAHAVSSAFGLLGYDLGRRVLSRRGGGTGKCPQFFLVQHLHTPDMVLSLRFGTFSPSRLPDYRLDPQSGLFVQDEDPVFPSTTHDPDESIDPTFYTHEPSTAPTINRIVSECGGGGIVVSRHECLLRYQDIRSRLAGGAVDLPSDPGALREWALVMAITGVLNGIDRDLIPEGADVVVHGSGSFGTGDYEPVDPLHTVPIKEAGHMAESVFRAIGT